MSAGMKLKNKPRSSLVQYRKIRKEVKKGARKIGARRCDAYKDIVSNWKNKPRFVRTVKNKKGGTLVIVRIANPNKKLSSGSASILDLWVWLDLTGTRPHKITGNPFLVFNSGTYVPKTTPVPTWGGPGTSRGGNLQFRQSVNHPGFPPRNFSKNIAQRLDKRDFITLKKYYKKALKIATK